MNRMLHLFGLVALTCAAAVTQSLQACAIKAIPEPGSEYPPPEGTTDPAAIARWKAERAASSSAYETVEQESQLRERRAELVAYAAEVETMDVARLAEGLAVNLTPPLQASFARRSDCDDLFGPEVLDPAGYYTLDDFVSVAIDGGYLDDVADAKFISRRRMRVSLSPLNRMPCLTEARMAVASHLARRFSRRELASALFLLRDNDFDRAMTDREITAGAIGYDQKANDFRLLSFSKGRSGALKFSEQARPNRWNSGGDAYREMRNRQQAEVIAFFEQNPLGQALIRETGKVLAQGTKLCPQATKFQDAFWKEMREATYAEKARRTKPLAKD